MVLKEMSEELAFKKWDDINLQASSYNFYQSYGNSRIVKDSDNIIKYHYALDKDNSLSMSSLCAIDQEGVNIPFGPILYKDVPIDLFYNYINEIKKTYNLPVFFCIEERNIDKYSQIIKSLEEIWHFTTVIIELPDKIENAFANFNENRRRIIRKSLQNLKDAIISEGTQHINEFYSLLEKRFGETNYPLEFSKDYLDILLNQRNTGLTVCKDKDGKILSGILSFQFGDTFINRYNCFDSTFADLNAGAFLEYHLINKAINNPQIKFYDMSGLASGSDIKPKEFNINRYKTSYGAQKIMSYKWYQY
jgi:lipid II:glycine glycyltransferase (peptidoglycan interpeptide bridge formation enzyme)